MPSSVLEEGEVCLQMDTEESVVTTMEEQSLISGRSIHDVENVLTAAKLDKTDIQSVTQEIIFDPNFSSTEFRLLQLDKDVLESIQTGEILVFRGDENDSAVLCTDKETYEIKEAETSNSLLLFQDLRLPDVKSPTGSTSSSTSKSPSGSTNTSLNSSADMNDSALEENEDSSFLTVKSRMIVDVSHSYLEMKRMRPNLSKIRFLLAGTEYNETIQDENACNHVYVSTLLEKVPASEKEIRDYLEENWVLEIDGKLRLVEDDYLFRILSQVLSCVDENTWHANEIDEDVVVDALAGLADSFFVRKIFQWFFQPVAEPGTTSAKQKYTYKEDKVCRFLGETLLKSMGKFNMKEFMKVWQESVPEGLNVHLKQLNGIAVFDQECSPPVIWHFPEYLLSESFTERLGVLFETKRRWKLDEISPFIEVFAPPSQNVGNLLTKYARSTTVNGIKYYSSKHGK